MQKDKIKSQVKEFFSSKNLAIMAMLTALSFVLYAFAKFPLPFMFPGFLDMQFSDLPALLGGFALGPTAGGIIIVCKCALKMPMSTTACVGELADIIIGLAFVLPSAIFYKFNKTKKGAIFAMLIGTVSAVALSILANWLILIPFYSDKFGMSAVVGMMQSLYPEITAESVYNYYLPLAVLPFNFLRCAICAVITYFVYKPLSKALHWERTSKQKKSEQLNEQPSAQKTDDGQENE